MRLQLRDRVFLSRFPLYFHYPSITVVASCMQVSGIVADSAVIALVYLCTRTKSYCVAVLGYTLFSCHYCSCLVQSWCIDSVGLPFCNAGLWQLSPCSVRLSQLSLSHVRFIQISFCHVGFDWFRCIMKKCDDERPCFQKKKYIKCLVMPLNDENNYWKDAGLIISFL